MHDFWHGLAGTSDLETEKKQVAHQKAIQDFDSSCLKKADTTEKNSLPDKEGKTLICFSCKWFVHFFIFFLIAH